MKPLRIHSETAFLKRTFMRTNNTNFMRANNTKRPIFAFCFVLMAAASNIFIHNGPLTELSLAMRKYLTGLILFSLAALVTKVPCGGWYHYLQLMIAVIMALMSGWFIGSGLPALIDIMLTY